MKSETEIKEKLNMNLLREGDVITVNDGQDLNDFVITNLYETKMIVQEKENKRSLKNNSLVSFVFFSGMKEYHCVSFVIASKTKSNMNFYILSNPYLSKEISRRQTERHPLIVEGEIIKNNNFIPCIVVDESENSLQVLSDIDFDKGIKVSIRYLHKEKDCCVFSSKELFPNNKYKNKVIFVFN